MRRTSVLDDEAHLKTEINNESGNSIMILLCDSFLPQLHFCIKSENSADDVFLQDCSFEEGLLSFSLVIGLRDNLLIALSHTLEIIQVSSYFVIYIF